MKTSLKTELPLLIAILIPFAYLYYVWDELPAKVPMHWNISGEVDRYGDKTDLIYIPLLLPALVYGLFLLIPKIDPKDKIKNMGSKYQSIKVLLTAFMSVLAMFIIYTSKNQDTANPNNLVLLLGVFFTFLGNYFKTIKHNYFLGIRTPWTLESEEVWKATHKLAGKIWFPAGLIIAAGSLTLDKETNFQFFGAVTIIITVIPVIYSYVKFKQLNDEKTT